MTGRKAPFRPKLDKQKAGEVYNDGVVTIYSVSDSARSGYLPREELAEKVALPYQELKLGIHRHYQAAQNQIRVEKVIRVPAPPEPITSQDQAITADGRRYRIDLVQLAAEVWPKSLDLTLAKYEQSPDGELTEVI